MATAHWKHRHPTIMPAKPFLLELKNTSDFINRYVSSYQEKKKHTIKQRKKKTSKTTIEIKISAYPEKSKDSYDGLHLAFLKYFYPHQSSFLILGEGGNANLFCSQVQIIFYHKTMIHLHKIFYSLYFLTSWIHLHVHFKIINQDSISQICNNCIWKGYEQLYMNKHIWTGNFIQNCSSFSLVSKG